MSEQTLEERVVSLLAERGLTISTAESCTGGLIAATIVNVPGASDVFLAGAVTYSNEAKMKMLGVKEETLDACGAVSRETAEEMSKGGVERMETDLCISSTGVAGPGGGTKKKPVGLVYISCCFGKKASTRKLNLSGDRAKIRAAAVREALKLVIETVEERGNE